MDPKEPDRRKRSLVTGFTGKEEMGALGGALGRLWLELTAPQELLDLRDKARQLEAQLHEQRVQIEALQAEQEVLTAQAEQDQAQIQALEQQLAERQAQVQLLLDQAKEEYVAAARAAVAEKDSGQAPRWNSILLRFGKVIVNGLALLVSITQGPQLVELYRERYVPVLRTLPTQLREQIMESIGQHLGEIQAQPASPLAAPGSPLDSPLPESEPKPSEEPRPISIALRDLELVRIPAGPFTLSKDAGGKTVMLPEFRISKQPVTRAQYRAFVAVIGQWKTPAGNADRRVEWFTWDDANAFCELASKETGQTVRMPTEAEWEKAMAELGSRNSKWEWTSTQHEFYKDTYITKEMSSGSAARGWLAHRNGAAFIRFRVVVIPIPG